MAVRHEERQAIHVHAPFATATRSSTHVPLPGIIGSHEVHTSVSTAPVVQQATSPTFSWTAPQQHTQPLAGAQPSTSAHSRIADGTVGFVIGVTVLAFVLTAVASFVATQG